MSGPRQKNNKSFQPRPYKPVPSMIKFHMSRAITRSIIGPRGSGKSTGIVWDIWLHMASMRPLKGTNIRSSKWVFVAETHDRIRSTAIGEWLFWFGAITEITYGVQVTAKVNARLEDGTEVVADILFSAADDLQSAGKFKSVQLTGVWMVEVAEFKTMDVYNMIAPCVGRWPSSVDGGPSWQGILMDTNSMHKGHWWQQQFEKQPEGWDFFSQPPALLDAEPFNPQMPEYVPNEGQDPRWPAAENIENLSGGFGYYFKFVSSMPREWVRVFVQNQFGKLTTSRRVYEEEYNDAVHAVHGLKPMRGVPLRLGFDAGRTPACVICQLDPQGRWNVLEEVIGKGISVQNFVKMQLAPILLKRYSGIPIIAAMDPAGFDKGQATDGTCADQLTEIGIDVKPAPSNKLVPRREAVASLLQQPGAFVMDVDMCPVLHDGFKSDYTLDEKGEPEKNSSSHVHDSLAYICLYTRVNPQTSAQNWSAAAFFGAEAKRQMGFGEGTEMVWRDGVLVPKNSDYQGGGQQHTAWDKNDRPNNFQVTDGYDPLAHS